MKRPLLRITPVGSLNAKLASIMAVCMDQARVNLSQLSKATGLAITTIKRMREDPKSNPTLESIEKVASFFGLSVSQLLGLEAFDQLDFDSSSLARQTKQVPLLTFSEVSSWLVHEASVSAMEDQSTVVTDLPLGKKGFAILMQGQSMAPVLPDGAVLIIDPLALPSDRDYVLVSLQGKSLPLVRQVLIDGSDFYLKALNPDFGDSQLMRMSEGSDKIVGVVIQVKLNCKQG